MPKTPTEFCVAALEAAGFKRQYAASRFMRFARENGSVVVAVDFDSKKLYHYCDPNGNCTYALTYPNVVGAAMAAMAIAGSLNYVGPCGQPYNADGTQPLT